MGIPSPGNQMKIELVIDNEVRIPVGYEMLEAALGYFEVTDGNHAQLETLASHPARDVRVTLARKENLTPLAFRTLFASRDFAVIEALLSTSANGAYFSRDMLAGLISQSEFGRIVANGLDDFPNADEGIQESLAKHPDPYVRNALAGNSSAPKKLFRLLAQDEDACVAQSAKRSLE